MTTAPRRVAGDDGQLVLLVLVYALVAAVLVVVVVDVSAVFLQRRSLVATADAASLAAANQPDLDRVYRGTGATLPLSAEGTRDAVDRYVVDAGLAERFRGFRVLDVSTDGTTVDVTFAATVRMPLLTTVTERVAGGYGIAATAHARSPFVP